MVVDALNEALDACHPFCFSLTDVMDDIVAAVDNKVRGGGCSVSVVEQLSRLSERFFVPLRSLMWRLDNNGGV